VLASLLASDHCADRTKVKADQTRQIARVY